MAIAASLMLALMGASPAPPEYDLGRFTLDLANDDFGSDVDEAFTSGIEALIRVRPGEGWSLSERLGFSHEHRIREHWGLVLGHQMYTPALLSTVDLEVLQNDRRYAGWVYGGLLAEVAMDASPFLDDGKALYRARLVFGSTGPRTQTASLQRYWHAFIRDSLNRRRLPEDPKGWSVYQVPNHWGVVGELTQESEVFRWSLEDRGLARDVGSNLGVRVASLAGARLGNMWIDAHVGAVVRAGLMPPVVFDDLVFFSAVEGERVKVPFAIFGYASARLIASAYDALLDGPPGAEGPWPERNPVMTRLEAGFGIRWSVVEFMFRHTTLSPDLASRPPGGVWIQNWGRFTVSFVYY